MTPAEFQAAARAMYDGAGGASLRAAPPGFAMGTKLATPNGAMAVERLRPGDLVNTPGGAPARVLGVTRRPVTAETMALGTELRPVRVRGHALGHLLPKSDVVLAPGQAVVLRGVVVPVTMLINGGSVRRAAPSAGVIYYGIRLDEKQPVVTEGLACAMGPVRVDNDVVLPLRAVMAELAGVRPGALQGNIARLDDAGVEGWVADEDHPGLPVGLEVEVGGKIVARGLADIRRPDLDMAGLGNCAFRIGFPCKLPAGRDWVVRVRRIGDGAEVPGSPVMMPRAYGDGATLRDGLAQAMAAAHGDAGRQKLAAFLAEQVDLLVQSRIDQPLD